MDNRHEFDKYFDDTGGRVMNEIKHCPFCGSHDVGGAGGQIHCYSCPATLQVQNTNTDYAVELWNRRAADEETDKLRQQLQQAEARVAELEESLQDLIPTLESISKYSDFDLGLDKGELEFSIERLEKVISNNRSSPFILRKQAEAVEAAKKNYNRNSRLPDGTNSSAFCEGYAAAEGVFQDSLDDYAQRLRKQADEAENG